MQKKQIIILTAVAAISLLSVGSVAAATLPIEKTLVGHAWGKLVKGKVPIMSGTITAINGNSLTITGRNKTVYTVDVTNAKISKGFGKNITALTVADVKIGDIVGVMGTMTGTNIAATSMTDGMGMRRDFKNHAEQQSPRLMGTVSNYNAYTFTLTMPVRKFFRQSTSTTDQPTSFIIDLNSTTTVMKDNKVASLGDIANGQTVVINGSIDNTTHIATANKVDIITAQLKPIRSMQKLSAGKMMRRPMRKIK